MPSPVVKSFAEKSGKSIQTVEKYWDEAKMSAREKFKRKDSHFWAYVSAIVQKRLGIAENKQSFKQFLTVINEIVKD